MNKSLSSLLRLLFIVAVVAIAWGLRARAVSLLPIDYDEDDYLRAGQQFAHLIRTSDWRGFLDTNYRPEHPPLAKIAYGMALLPLPEQPLIPDAPITAEPAKSLPADQLQAARTEAAIFGTLTALLLALFNPLGGMLLAIHSFTIKYTSQVMLDGLSALLSLGTVMAYVRYKKKKQTGWMIASAILLGLAADSKFLHGTIGFAILLDWLYGNWSSMSDSSRRAKLLRTILWWGVLSLIVFFAANPFLWPDPVGRLKETLAAVHNTTANSNVARANYPFWQQINWLAMSVPWDGNPPAFLIKFDTFILLLAAFGVKRLWKKEPAFVFWLAVELLVLLLWRTKWPQYILIATAPLALSAGEGLGQIWENIPAWWKGRRNKQVITYKKSDLRQVVPWLIPGLVAFGVLTLFPLIFQLLISATTLNGASLRDGLQGGIWREVWGGLTGRIPIASPNADLKQVHYIGWSTYSGVMGWINAMGIPFFNVMWTVLSVAVQTVLGIGAALLLWQRGIKFKRSWQVLFILPWAIPEAIGALLWLNIFAPLSGWLTLAVKEYGSNVPFSFLVGWEYNPDLTLIVLSLSALWYGFPFIMLAAGAGLKMLPQEVFDAASIDGANAWQSFRYVTWPLLQPLILPAIVVRGIFAFNQFYLFQMLVPVYQRFDMITLSRLSYFLVYDSSEFAISAVINVIAIVILIGFVVLFNRWSRAGEGVSYA
jgi:arabinogalactan oligomer/maltooligosaccharide transport system permease protein